MSSCQYCRDKEGEQLHASWDATKKDYKEKALHYSAIQIIKTGDLAEVVNKEGTVSSKGKYVRDFLFIEFSS